MLVFKNLKIQFQIHILFLKPQKEVQNLSNVQKIEENNLKTKKFLKM